MQHSEEVHEGSQRCRRRYDRLEDLQHLGPIGPRYIYTVRNYWPGDDCSSSELGGPSPQG